MVGTMADVTSDTSTITLVLGGASSGKSARALGLLSLAPQPGLLVATGRGLDQDFRERVLDHKRARPADLAVREVLTDLPQVLMQATTMFRSILVDSLDFWLFSCLEAGSAQEMTSALIETLTGWTGPDLLLVSCETGLGPTAPDAAARRFVKALGELNQRVGALAARVELVAAGQALRLK